MANSNDAKSKDDCMLLALPRELRDNIYKHYLQVEGGYVYDFESGKLGCTTPSGGRTPIDLNLMLSCRQIAAEMQGLALNTNTITFSSCSPAAKQRNIAYCQVTSYGWWNRTFSCLWEEDSRNPSNQDNDEWWPVPNFDESVCRTIAEAFPKFEPHLRTIQFMASDPHRPGDRFDDMTDEWIDFPGEQVHKLLFMPAYWGEVPSLQRQAVVETLKLISSRDCWSQYARSDTDEEGEFELPTKDRVGDLVRYHSLFKPWTIPEDDARCDISADTRHPAHPRPKIMTAEEYTRERHGISTNFAKDRQYFLSAASIAIEFLERIPVQRRNIRYIILDEKDPRVNRPECHGLGLIDFCKENPNLRIERRANLWRTIWPLKSTSYQPFSGWDRDEWDRGGYHEEDVTERVARWIMEALALVPAGMPPGSFTLVLDGNPAPEHCAQLFQRVQRDAAWQIALGESFNRGHLPKTAYHDRRRIWGYFYEGFPQALREISTGTCRAVRANFDVGEPWDAEVMIEAHREWTLSDWAQKWFFGTPILGQLI
ncbi:hypothetical protein LA080_001609 [Diaporthe eres]|nr:hypothetical protein LA080_001609 [Diaporthe eres]